VNKIPGGPRVRVFVGTTFLVALSAVPVFIKKSPDKQGHDLFSQEKPEAISASTEKLQREYRKSKEAEESGKNRHE
jgi:hypothetical protein